MSDKIFTTANKLSDYSVKIGEINLIKECIISVEIIYDNSSPKILSSVIFDDLYDMNLQQEWNETTVQINYIDVFETQVQHDFIIVDIIEKYNNQNDKFFIIKLQDKFSYILEHSFLSKSFNTNIINAIEEYITELNLENYNYDFSSLTENYNFIISKHIHNLESFQIELRKQGFSFYQTKNAIVIKSLTDLIPSSLPINGLYLNETDNQLYMNRIIELRNIFNRRNQTPPSTRAVAFDLSTKTIQSLESNDITDYILNTDITNPQDTYGILDIYQIHLNFNQNKKEMKDRFLSRGNVEIVVNGYGKNDLNQIYELKLKGNKSTADLQSKGNQIINGKYISTHIIDKIVADTMIQKITLMRADLTKWN
jgi:hypothetical protein